MARQCKFLHMNHDQWDDFENELAEWINDGYEVKQIVALNQCMNYEMSRSGADCGILVYLEREVPDSASRNSNGYYSNRSGNNDFPF